MCPHRRPLHRATISQHVGILRRIGLILPYELEDSSLGYQLNQEMYTYAKELIESYLQQVA